MLSQGVCPKGLYPFLTDTTTTADQLSLSNVCKLLYLNFEYGLPNVHMEIKKPIIYSLSALSVGSVEQLSILEEALLLDSCVKKINETLFHLFPICSMD